MTTEKTTSTAPAQAAGRPTVAVELQTPIVRKAETITTLQVMRPRVGDMRGLLLAEILQMKVEVIAKLLPRITVPTLIAAEVEDLDPADLVAISIEVAAFLAPKSAMESLST